VLTVDLGLAATRAQPPEWLTEAVSHLGDTPATAATFTGPAASIAAALMAARDLKDVLAAPLLALDPASVSLAIEQAGADASPRVPHRLLYNPRSGSTYLVYWGVPPSSAALTVTLMDPSGRQPTIRDPLRRR
jgi:hypothetical protein